MGQTLIDKLNILFSAKLHDIVNRALQRNPIQVLNEYLRQHEDAYLCIKHSFLSDFC